MFLLCFSFVQHEKLCSCQDAQRTGTKTISELSVFSSSEKITEICYSFKSSNVAHIPLQIIHLQVKYSPFISKVEASIILTHFYLCINMLASVKGYMWLR